MSNRYQRLRDDLEAAYAANVWDSSQIDRIADEMVETELALAGQHRVGGLAGHGQHAHF